MPAAPLIVCVSRKSESTASAGASPALEREQRLDDPVEPLARLVAEDLDELGVGLGHAACSPSAAKTRATSTTPTSRPSSSAACVR